MTIIGSADIYSIYTSQALFNGQVTVEISTDGKFLIDGQLNFANNNVSISGKLYVDLSQVTSGSVTVLFLANVPTQVKLLTLYGKLQMGFENASGQPVTFAVAATAGIADGGEHGADARRHRSRAARGIGRRRCSPTAIPRTRTRQIPTTARPPPTSSQHRQRPELHRHHVQRRDRREPRLRHDSERLELDQRRRQRSSNRRPAGDLLLGNAAHGHRSDPGSNDHAANGVITVPLEYDARPTASSASARAPRPC